MKREYNFLIPCIHCGVREQRDKYQANASCFPCKKLRQKVLNDKRRNRIKNRVEKKLLAKSK